MEEAVMRLTEVATSSSTSTNEPQEPIAKKDADETKPVPVIPEPVVEEEVNAVEQLLRKWEAEGSAFSQREYAKGQVPEGDYIWLRKKGSGDGIVKQYGPANLNLMTLRAHNFAYVKILPAERVTQSSGNLIKVSAVLASKYPTALKLFCARNDIDSWNFSGMYHIGLDIPAGVYRVKKKPNEDFGDLMWWKNIPGHQAEYRDELVRGTRDFKFIKGEFIDIYDAFFEKK
ncbi:hypothetical protein N9067_04165 [Akkermansiaceae bacterium]|nr:hypothetical protein [Akkermansiaceae bacterium]